MPRAISPGAAAMAPLRPPPPPPQPFVGRERERAALARGLEQRGAVIITGVAGAGKTALLADHAARAGRAVEWVEVYRSLSDSGEALFWQVARPLADLSPQLWQTLHRMAQGGSPYPLAARLQVALAAYARLEDAPLLVIDGVEHLEQPEALALLAALCDHVASGRAGDLRLAAAGRTLPYRLNSYALPPLAGLDVAAAQLWARELGLSLTATAASELLAISGGVPMALADTLLTRASGVEMPAETDRRLWALLAGLPPAERDLLVALARDEAPDLRPLERRAELARLEGQHLVGYSGHTGVLVHPMIRAFIGSHTALR